MRIVIVAAAAIASVAGCKEAHVREAFFPAPEDSPTRRVLAAQVRRGAGADATLYPMHFDGPALNALGRAKLDLMLEDGGMALPLTVYLGVVVEGMDLRRAAVEGYLSQAGLEASQFNTIAGVNPGETHVASESFSRIAKTESPQASNAGSAQTSVKFDVSGMSATAE